MDIFSRLASQATDKLASKVSSRLSSKVLKYTTAARKLLGGDIDGAANAILDNIYGAGSSYGAGNVALARSTWAAMYQQYREAQGVLRERQNLWHILIEPVGKIGAPRVNLLAQEVSYNGTQLGYDTRKLGSGFTQAPTGRDPVTLTITTLDSADGEIKGWMDNLQALAAHPDGTFGLLSDYANTFTITHAHWEEGRGYTRSWVLVPVDDQVSLNRTAEEFSSITLTFTQAETYGAI